MIHTIGDSHSINGWSDVVSHHLGALLCYSFGADMNRCDLRNYSMNDGDTLIFCLGEIDCRCHVHKHITSTYQEVIQTIVDKYIDAIRFHVTQSDIKFKHICVYNVVPPVRKDNTHEDPNFPYLGSDEERKTYTLYFNEKIKEKCSENNYIFFDVYHHYTDEHGFLNKELSDGHVHIRNGEYISEFIQKWL